MGEPFVLCSNPSIGWVELLNSVLVKDPTTGAVGIRSFTLATEEDAPAIPYVECGVPLNSIEGILRRVVRLDANGKPAICFIGNPGSTE